MPRSPPTSRDTRAIIAEAPPGAPQASTRPGDPPGCPRQHRLVLYRHGFARCHGVRPAPTPPPLLLLAGLRNGSAECGVTYLALRRDFWAEARRLSARTRRRGGLGPAPRPDHRRPRSAFCGTPELADSEAEGRDRTGRLCRIDRTSSGPSRSATSVPRTRAWSSSRRSGRPCVSRRGSGRLAIPMVDSWGGLSDALRTSGGWSHRSLVRGFAADGLRRGLPDRTVRFLARDRPEVEEFEWRSTGSSSSRPSRRRSNIASDTPPAGGRRLQARALLLRLHDLTRPWDSS